jgi:hypothetical protein
MRLLLAGRISIQAKLHSSCTMEAIHARVTNDATNKLYAPCGKDNRDQQQQDIFFELGILSGNNVDAKVRVRMDRVGNFFLFLKINIKGRWLRPERKCFYFFRRVSNFMEMTPTIKDSTRAVVGTVEKRNGIAPERGGGWERGVDSQHELYVISYYWIQLRGFVITVGDCQSYV